MARQRAGLGEKLATADGLHDEAHWGDVGHVNRILVAATAGEETANPSNTIDYHGAGIALFREGASFIAEGQNRPLFGNPRDTIAKVGASVGEDVVGAPDGQAGRAATLEDHDARFAILVVLRISSSEMLPRRFMRRS